MALTYTTKEDSDVLRIFGKNIRSVRTAKGLTIQKLAELAKCSRDGLSLLENGERDSNFDIAIKIARSLNVAFPDLVSRNFDCNNSSRYIDDDFILVFAENLSKQLKMLEMNQYQLSQDTGITESNISKILNGKNKNPKLTTLDLLSKAIQVDLEQLLTR